MFIEAINKITASHKATRPYQLPSFFFALVLALTIYPTQAHAQIIGDLEAKVPFQFQVGDTKFPAGEYRIHVLDDGDPNAMEISSADGTTSALFQVQNTEARPASHNIELILNRHGNRYFLAKLFEQGSSNGSQVAESRYEKRVSQETMDAQEHLAAHRRGQRGK
jgi:hypothetical protein